MGMVYCPTQAKHFLVKAPESPAGHLPSVPPDVLPVLQDQQVMVEPNWTRQSKLKTRIRIFPCIICAYDKLLKIANKFYIKFQNKKNSLIFQNNSTRGDIHELYCLKITHFNPTPPPPLQFFFAKQSLFSCLGVHPSY